MPIKSILHIVTLLLLFTSVVNGQTLLDEKVDLNLREKRFDEVLDEIRLQTGISFSYYAGLFKETQRFTIGPNQKTVGEALDFLFLGTEISYGLFKDQVILYRPKPKPASNYKLSGYVIDSLTNQRIDQAHIYLDQTDIGTFTDIDGYFSLEGIPGGAYDLVISHVSYGVYNFVLNITKDENELEIRVSPRVNVLRELEVVSVQDQLFAEYVRLFRREVLGNTPNARQCVINNPEDLLIYTDTTHGKNEFEIYTSKPISITNNSLGYKILYDLVFFESKDSQILFIGRSNFSTIESNSKKEMKRWRKNRKAVYKGSLRDFVRSAYADDQRKHKFRRSVVEMIPDSLKFKYFPADIKSEAVLKLVAISKELNDGKYMEIYHTKTKSTSYISKADFEFKGGYKYKLIKDYFDPKKGVLIYGNWASRRLADTLPLNFLISLENSNEKLRGKRRSGVN